ncbi:MAG: PepSY-associated TM helix domain-containing protein [Sphingomonas bacterium]
MAMSQTAIRRWYLVHKWTSLVCTVFLLLLCVTGLPLIFHDEIDAMTRAPAVAAAAKPAPPPRLDDIVAKALASRPGEVMMFLSHDPDKPIWYAITAPRVDSKEDEVHIAQFDARTGMLLKAPPLDTGVMHFLLELHSSLLLGLPGEMVTALVGLIFLASLVSGVVVYAPFMRKLAFGTVRKMRSARVKWLDTHNMIGIVALAWLTVVGATGVITALSTPIAGLWQMGQLAEMTAPYRNAPPIRRLGSVDEAVRVARGAAPSTSVSIIAWPGSFFSSKHHYAVFLSGNTPLTKKLIKPALVDAETGRLTAIEEMPLYVKALFLSQPLHFGDYGGLPLKIIWALLDIAAIVVLGTGLYLWLGRRRVPIEKRIMELNSGGTLEAAE